MAAFKQWQKVRVKPRKGQIRSGERGYVVSRKGKFCEVAFPRTFLYHKEELERAK